ncbi:Prefoldin subunit 4 [Orchesella cincta]|uniref:Prefoldin subunit 4 n=1 Tax=Orchesella cincta TaxID=48709 RepID=A0A1D2MJ02_ORCCI|nr:Prefoldin subunit 4 [Orchesella cincta]
MSGLKSESSDSDVHISHENQKKINRFAIMNGWIEEIQDSLSVKQTLLTHLEDAENDLLLSDVLMENPDMQIPVLVGESFVSFTNDEVQEHIQGLKDRTKKEIEGLESRVKTIKSEMDVLKTALYEQFGNNINLENDGSVVERAPSFPA